MKQESTMKNRFLILSVMTTLLSCAKTNLKLKILKPAFDFEFLFFENQILNV
jgi:hypothetical protein